MSGHGACGEGCGWCGRCSDADERLRPSLQPSTCDRCNGDAFYAVTTPLGVYCSHKCESADAAEFTERMRRRGHMQVETHSDDLAQASGDK